MPNLNANPTVTIDESKGPRADKDRFLGAFWTRKLPDYTGPYNVACSDLELSVGEKRRFGTFLHKKYPSHEGGIALETLLCSMYYPAAPASQQPPQRSKHPTWFPKLAQTVHGFMRMARSENPIFRWVACTFAFIAVFGTKFPAFLNGVLLKPPEGKKWPVVFFSHGVGCGRLMYSQICGEIASRGYIVFAIEHRDGSGPSTTIELEDGTLKNVDFLDWNDLEWPDLETRPTSDNTLRKDQLQLRLAELEFLYNLLKGTAGLPHFIRAFNKQPDIKAWRSAWDMENCHMAGHSFGGSLALAAGADPRFTFKSIVAFDPAMERLEPWNGHITTPVLCVNSQEFASLPDFQRLIDVRKTFDHSEIYTITGATHPSFSDVGVILPQPINRMIGLRASPDDVLHFASVAATKCFKHGLEYTEELTDGKMSRHTCTKKNCKAGHLLKYASELDSLTVAVDLENVKKAA